MVMADSWHHYPTCPFYLSRSLEMAADSALKQNPVQQSKRTSTCTYMLIKLGLKNVHFSLNTLYRAEETKYFSPTDNKILYL